MSFNQILPASKAEFQGACCRVSYLEVRLLETKVLFCLCWVTVCWEGCREFPALLLVSPLPGTCLDSHWCLSPSFPWTECLSDESNLQALCKIFLSDGLYTSVTIWYIISMTLQESYSELSRNFFFDNFVVTGNESLPKNPQKYRGWMEGPLSGFKLWFQTIEFTK